MPILIIRDCEMYGYSPCTEIYGVLVFPNLEIKEKAISIIEDVQGLDGWSTEDIWEALSELPYEWDAFNNYDTIEI